MSLIEVEKAAGRLFRDGQVTALSLLNQVSPPDLAAICEHRYIRHDCRARGGVSFALELREHWVSSPEYMVCYCGRVDVRSEEFPHWDCAGATGVAAAEGRFGFYWKWGRCAGCEVYARSSEGRFVVASERPPDSRGARERKADARPAR